MCDHPSRRFLGVVSVVAQEIIVPFAATLAAEPAATHCRGHADRRVDADGEAARSLRALCPCAAARVPLDSTITSTVASTWIPIDVGVAHYRACDALDLPPEEQLEMGGEVVRNLQKTFIGAVLKAASSGVGVTPFVGLQKFTTIYSRSIKGGGARVVRVGPKDVRVEFVGLPLAGARYFRVAYRGFIRAGCEFFARRVVVAELAAFLSPTTVAYRIAWV